MLNVMTPWMLVFICSLSAPGADAQWSALPAVAPSATVRVPAVDAVSLREADKRAVESPEKDMERIGVFQGLPQSVRVDGAALSHGVWTTQPDASLIWAVRVIAEKAVGQRIELRELNLPAGAGVYVYSENDPSERFGPYDSIPSGESSLWTPVCFGESVVLVCRVPREEDTAQVKLVLNRIGYLYRFPVPDTPEKFAGTCNLDVSCYSEWANAALAVGGLSIIGQTGILFCTCTLIADTQNCTEVPYVLTAHHCVGNQNGSLGAEYLDFYWQYQTSTCGGSAPMPWSVPRTTGGSDYLAGTGGRGDSGGGNDFTLLRLRNMPPENVAHAEWSDTVPPVGTEVVCIHHPRGSYKRISFGTLTNTNNLYPNYFHEVTWHDGVTEPGSSGSPLFIAGTQKIIGQLWGGDSACNNATAPDYYGRFDVTYASISAWVNPGPATVGFSASEYLVSETEGRASITVVLSGKSAGGVSIEYEALPGTATANTDFTPVHGTLNFGRGVSSQSFDVPILPDMLHEAAETVLLHLKNSSCPALGVSESILTIVDDDTDTDGDGLSDYDEINGTFGYTSSPNLADTDQDHLTDYEEVMGTHGYKSNPNLGDSDGDGINDYLEIIFGLDPLNPNDATELTSLEIPWFK